MCAAPVAAQDADRHGAIRIGNPQAPVQLALVANAGCPECHDLFALLFDPGLLEGARASPVALALEDGRLHVVWRSRIETQADLVGDLLARCSSAPGETMRRLSSEPDAWFVFPHPTTGAPIDMSRAEFEAILTPVPPPDLLSPGALLACPRDQQTGQQVMGHFGAVTDDYGRVDPPMAFVNGTRVDGRDAIVEALRAALRIDDAAYRRDRLAYPAARMQDLDARIAGDPDHVPRTGTRPLDIPGAPG
ncbi:MAG: hypothetical protein HLUCCA08_06405 [Rhodobacteraceae bacterium HLUCCA08]|nr:MAG: hypothetical protein HLUCCA08_06405 [Rhodobacteraceae bacterium HLUCCA08]